MVYSEVDMKKFEVLKSSTSLSSVYAIHKRVGKVKKD